MSDDKDKSVELKNDFGGNAVRSPVPNKLPNRLCDPQGARCSMYVGHIGPWEEPSPEKIPCGKSVRDSKFCCIRPKNHQGICDWLKHE